MGQLHSDRSRPLRQATSGRALTPPVADLADLERVLAETSASPLLSDWEVRLLAPREPAPIDLVASARRALQAPHNSPTLAQIARDKRTAVVVISDATRAVPNRLLLPLVLEELRAGGLSESAVTVIVGTGAHRAPTEAELDDLLGRELRDRVHVISHDARGESVLVGRTTSGNEVRVNLAFARAQVRIAIGLVEPHEFAGFTGGRKAVLPGVAAAATILRNHSLGLLSHPRARPGILEGNPIHEEMLEAARRAGLHFIVNVVLDRALRPLAIAAGDPDAAHRELTRFVQGYARLSPPADLQAVTQAPDVIVTGPGQPLDCNLYQSIKALVAVEPWAARDTTTILLSRCWDGTGSRDMLAPFAAGVTPAQVLRSLARDYTVEKDHAYFVARFLARSPSVVAYCPGVDQEDLRRIGFAPAASVADALRMAMGRVRRRPLGRRTRPIAIFLASPQRSLLQPWLTEHLVQPPYPPRGEQ